MAAARRRRTGVGVMRRKRKDHRYGVASLLLLGALALGGLVGFTWTLDRELAQAIVDQRREAAARPDWVALDALPGEVVAAFRSVVDGEAEVARALVREVYAEDGDLLDEARVRTTAALLRRRLSDETILETYLNRVRLGREWGWKVNGVGAAAREYFGKRPQALTLGEAATLAGLRLPPHLTDPRDRAGPAGARRNDVLHHLWLRGEIDRRAYRTALREPLGFQPGLEHLPMTRPLDWDRESAPLRLGPEAAPAPSDQERSPEE